jgi:hypothetical protein
MRALYFKGGKMPEPITTVGLGAVVAYLSKDGLNKMLGPTADYLGDSLRDFAQKRTENVGKIFGNAESKLGNKLDQPGQVPPKVLKTIINEGSYSDDEIAIEYFGGILASSRTEQGRDDRGARIGKVLDGLSIYQIRTHYIVYSLVRKLFKESGYLFNMDDRPRMQIFIPWGIYCDAMEFDQKEMEQVTSILNHSFFGLNTDNLIETFQYGPKEHINNHCPEAQSDGILVFPSAFGAELYLWGYGFGEKDLSYVLNDDAFEDMAGIPLVEDGVIPADKKHNKSKQKDA